MGADNMNIIEGVAVIITALAALAWAVLMWKSHQEIRVVEKKLLKLFKDNDIDPPALDAG